MIDRHVCVIGLGYIGLPTATILASKGFYVTGIDTNVTAVNIINRGDIHIVEMNLAQLVSTVVKSGHLKATVSPCAADVFILAVPTPFKENHQPDLSYIEQATLSIAPFLKSGNMIILESTSPVGTTEQLATWLHHVRPDLNIPGVASQNNSEQLYISHCPERVLPGQILKELVSNDRVIGGLDKESGLKAKIFYQTFCTGEIMLTDARTAEMTKLTENAFRDVNIAFANELANICDRLKINVWELIKLANHHPRVNVLQPGPGVGGHCIAVDPWFIVNSAPNEAKLIRTAREVNDARPDKVLAQIYEALLSKPNAIIACLGLTFKANVDDLRESPAMLIVEKLAQQVNNTILVVEPHIKQLPDKLRGYIHLHQCEFIVAFSQADIVITLVNHDNFLNINSLKKESKIIIDTRGLINNLNIT
jgi:UDP-N-acetyl-D-mannosaminuronic acid dehydrogenase